MSDRMQSRPTRWPVMSGTVPFLTERFTPRPETAHGPWDALHPGMTVVLGPDADRAEQNTFRGGTGKTRLAAAFAARLWTAADLDLLVWLDAGSRTSILTGYARALADIGVAGPEGKPEAAASRFLTWLADTSRGWLVVLDGLVESADADGLWPQGESGQSIVTSSVTGLSPSPVTGTNSTSEPGANFVSSGLPFFSPREALDYLSTRLDDDPYHSAGALDLAMALSGMPAALALAVPYLLDTFQDCRQYRLSLDHYRRTWIAETRSDPLAPCWMLAIDRATQSAPRNLSWPALKLAAVLGPSWIPGAVLTSSVACAFVTGRQDVTSADQASVRAAFGSLERVGLVTIGPADEVRTVRLPSVLQNSVRQVMGAAEVRRAVQAAADALSECWPEGGSATELEQALRDCATSVRRCDEQALWNHDCHPLLLRMGRSLDEASMTETAVSYWWDLATRCAGYLGARSPVTLQVRGLLADAAMAAGRTDEAVSMRERLAADIDEIAGPAHPEAIASRTSLAVALRTAGRLSEAILLGNRIASDSDRVLGPGHAQTTAILSELGSAYRDAGQYPAAIGALERCLAFRVQTIGLMHPETLVVRHRLAGVYRRSNRAKDAIRLYQEVLTQLGKAAGMTARDALTARENLAIAYYRTGLTDEAVTTLEKALAEWQRVPGGDAASILSAQASLAAICCGSGRLKEAIQLFVTEIAALERTRGADHSDVLRARWNLAAAYHKARRLPEAVKLGEETLADCERALGPGHRETLTSRANLAHVYHATGQLKRASAHFDRAVRDCVRALGTDDPLTRAVQELRQRYLAGRQGAAPIISPPVEVTSHAERAPARSSSQGYAALVPS